MINTSDQSLGFPLLETANICKILIKCQATYMFNSHCYDSLVV